MSEINVKLALDLGTTTLAGALIDQGGTVLCEVEAANPQERFGQDVVSRLEASVDGRGEELQALLVEGIEEVVSVLLNRAGLPRSAIVGAAAAGNPAVSCLLRNLPVKGLLFPPYRPPEKEGAFLDAAALGLELPVPLYLFPLVSGYVGGDLVAFLYSQQPFEEGTFYLDVGTNGEMALYVNGKWWVTSVAAGPAFEGGNISCGMAARRGAVEDVSLSGDSLSLRVIGGGPPRGLCGTGLAVAVGSALEGGLINRHGEIVDPLDIETNLARCIVETPAGRAIRLYRDASTDLLITQDDIRNFQLAKGAIKAGAEVLLQQAGLNDGQIRRLVITGAFGFSLPVEALKKVAMLPPNMLDKVVFTPGGVLAGVRRFLGEPDGVSRVQSLAPVLRPFPLSGTPAFEKAFIKGLDF